MDTININNIAYVRADQVQLIPKGSREVVVIDRGLIMPMRVELPAAKRPPF